MLRPELLRIFVTVYETSSFTKTAENLNLPKATVSESINRLEAQLDTRLFQRTTRRVLATHDGEQFFERAITLLADLEEAESLFQKQGPEISGRVRVDMPVPLARDVIIPQLPNFLAKYPNLKIELGSTDRRVDVVQEGFDFVVRAGTLGDSSLIAKKIGEYSMSNLASPAYLKRYGTPRSLDDLDRHYQVHYQQTFGGKADGFEYWDGSKFAIKKTRALVTVNNTEAYRAASLAGLGIVQSPNVGMQDCIRSGKLKKILTKYESEPAPVHIVFASRAKIAKRVRLFMDWVEVEFRKYSN